MPPYIYHFPMNKFTPYICIVVTASWQIAWGNKSYSGTYGVQLAYKYFSVLRTIFHRRSCLWVSWTTSEAGMRRRHSEWACEAWVEKKWLGSGCKRSLCGWDIDIWVLPQQTGGRTSWAHPRWFYDHPQIWGWWCRGVCVSKQISINFVQSHHFHYVKVLNC